jgi:hypothetical protein
MLSDTTLVKETLEAYGTLALPDIGTTVYINLLFIASHHNPPWQIKSFLKDMGQPIDSAAFRAIVFDQDEVRQCTFLTVLSNILYYNEVHGLLTLLLTPDIDKSPLSQIPLLRALGHEAFWR